METSCTTSVCHSLQPGRRSLPSTSILMASAEVSTTGTGVGIGNAPVSGKVEVTGPGATRAGSGKVGTDSLGGGAVGMGVGTKVGVAVGAAVGVAEGVAVGCGVGEGVEVGSGVSEQVGTGGSAVNVAVGGRSVGSGKVGTRVGSIKTDKGFPLRNKVKMHIAGTSRISAHTAPSARLLIFIYFTSLAKVDNAHRWHRHTSPFAPDLIVR